MLIIPDSKDNISDLEYPRFYCFIPGYILEIVKVVSKIIKTKLWDTFLYADLYKAWNLSWRVVPYGYEYCNICSLAVYVMHAIIGRIYEMNT